MSVNLIGDDIKLMRDRYDEALEMFGIPATYQYPLMAGSNAQGEPVIDSYSEMKPIHIFFEGNPKLKTFKRLGWVVENSQDLPILIHCSFHLQHLQKDCLFHISGQYSELPERVFRVTELTCDAQAPDHMIAQVVPVYDDQAVGYTKKEVEKKYNTSNHFLKPKLDYRGNYHNTQEDGDPNFRGPDGKE